MSQATIERLARMFPRQRGIIGINFGASKRKGSTTQRQEVDRTRTTQLESEKETTGTETATQRQVTELFTPEVQTQLEGILTNLTAGQGGEATRQLRELATTLGQRAETAEADLNRTNQAILSEARRQGERTIGRSTTELATVAGSSQNTLVQQQRLELQNDLEAQLASLDAQLQRENRGVATEEFRNALAALTAAAGSGATDVNSIAAIGTLLRGGRAVVTGEQQVQSTEREILDTVETLTDIIRSLTTGTSTQRGSSFGFTLGGGQSD